MKKEKVGHNRKLFNPTAMGGQGERSQSEDPGKDQQQLVEMNKLRQSSSCWSSTQGFNEARLT